MPGLSIIIPASNEAALIGRCLKAILASDPKPGAGSGSIPLPMPVEVIVVANGCSDDTAGMARGYARGFAAMGWDFKVLELAKGSKPAALNEGDRNAKFRSRAYLDADVVVSKPLLDQVGRALRINRPAYVSGRVNIAPPRSAISKLYAQTYARVPFMTQGVPGCGFFAVNGEGRRRWKQFPNIISDDTFVRLLFSPKERVAVAATYDWPLVEGWANLVKVRARQDAGVREVLGTYPQLARNDDKPALGILGKLLLFLRNPPSFAVYAGVALATKLKGDEGWSRGR
ncbi:glycosyltransferase family A protein [Marimonas lutisalis]|uniref:glycosyltransferase family A protein n=1 Tax=Marimonas lutisalis TaxID=2545756 RepID=UPI0010F9B22D|nr:glycosyltransferase family A protein [Marimonas lutisalis]